MRISIAQTTRIISLINVNSSQALSPFKQIAYGRRSNQIYQFLVYDTKRTHQPTIYSMSYMLCWYIGQRLIYNQYRLLQLAHCTRFYEPSLSSLCVQIIRCQIIFAKNLQFNGRKMYMEFHLIKSHWCASVWNNFENLIFMLNPHNHN